MMNTESINTERHYPGWEPWPETLILGNEIGLPMDLSLTDGDAIDHALLCQRKVDCLTMGNGQYRSLLASLNDLRRVLDAPLQNHICDNAQTHEATSAPFALDSTTLLEYCITLTELLDTGAMNAKQSAIIDGLLFDLVYLQAAEISRGSRPLTPGGTKKV
ncbi:hypothetical protein CIG19_19765 [Enterobacterales bacterium CwR94]|nr:hypothetical protein CIG19_19765 [Enterobacterales bacterium CwR94]